MRLSLEKDFGEKWCMGSLVCSVYSMDLLCSGMNLNLIANRLQDHFPNLPPSGQFPTTKIFYHR